MSKKTLTWLLVFSLLINISSIATISYYRWFKAEKPIPPYEKFRGRKLLAEKMKFTPEQRQQLRELRQKLFKETMPLKNELHQKRIELLEILKQDSVSIDQINHKIDEISEIEKTIDKKTIANLLNYRTMLTDEQRDRFLEMMTERMFLPDRRGPKHMRPFNRGNMPYERNKL